MSKRRKWKWALLILLLAGGTVWVISGLEREMQSVEVVTDEELLQAAPVYEAAGEQDWGYDKSGAFFVEYRLQRDRVRDQEVEMLEGIINNPNAGQAAREEAENLLMDIVRLMEQELLVENMIKAMGFEDAIFFYRNRVATVMVRAEELSDREFLQIAEAVAGIVNIPREEVQVITRP